MERALADRILQWHLDNGGFNGRLAGHAVRMLREMVELCIASGASTKEISQAVVEEFRKAREKKEVTEKLDYDKAEEEAADVAILFELFKTYGGMDYRIWGAVEKKLEVIGERLWEVDADGVLWRPGARTEMQLYPDDPDRKPA